MEKTLFYLKLKTQLLNTELDINSEDLSEITEDGWIKLMFSSWSCFSMVWNGTTACSSPGLVAVATYLDDVQDFNEDSQRCSDMNMVFRASKPASLMAVMAVACKQWGV
ncbi:uncharacterized protein LOC125661648 [Ostrea edulis]|uniref:uncharacterized protein LOC125661648 n=1 Tax=Ostrea edulis TaxID=37623 RepID=UPI0024AEC8A1|nr:uncharacterized protein LOC125661648 [Ostrea edulis]